VHAAALYEERFVCLVRRGHPQVREALTLPQYLELPHVLVRTSRGDRHRSLVDRTLTKHGLQRRVGVSLPHFLVAPFVVAASDHVMTCPSRLADAFARTLPLQVLEPPLVLPTYTIRLYWHERSQREPASAWVRGQVQAECAAFAAPNAPRDPEHAAARPSRQRDAAAPKA
jgi:DNA-binding transcriptional LysR family regulator